MVTFQVFGPFDVDCEISRRGRRALPRKVITKEVIRKFWESVAAEHAHIASKKGCYVFALRAGRGSMPWYVGKTEKSARTLKQEVFDREKLAKYRTILKRSRRRSPEIYLVVRSEQQGRLGRAIDDLETVLIWAAFHRNKGLLNKRKRETHPARLIRIVSSIAIAKLLNGGPGAPDAEAASFDAMLRFRERKASTKNTASA